MRPCGEIRLALTAAAIQLAAQNAGFTYSDLASKSKVGRDVARTTLKNMVKSGELTPVGTRQVKGVRRPLRTYKLCSMASIEQINTLANAMRGWGNTH